MTTIRFMDSFQHRVGSIAGVWYTLTNGGTGPNHGGGGITFDTGQKRTAAHTCSMKIVQDGTNVTNALFPALNATPSPNLAANVIVFSFYIRVASNPGAQSEFFTAGNATDVSRLEIDTTGHVVSQVKAGTARTSSATVSDGNWHRIDVKLDYSTTTGKLDVSVDGVANTQATATVSVANITVHRIGSTVAADNLTAWFSDYVVSGTGADHPIGDHIVLPVFVTGDGTHSQSTGSFLKSDGGNTNYFQAIDDAWDGTTPELSQTGEDFIRQQSIATAGYVEFTIGTPTEPGTYWNVQLRGLWAAEDSTTANTTAILLRHSTTDYCSTGLIDPSLQAASYSGFVMADQGTVPAGGWDASKIGAARIRWGFSDDAAPDPLLNAVLLEFAASWKYPLTGTLFTKAPTFNAGTITPGAVNLAGSLFSRAPTFFAGAITARYALAGSLFTRAPTFFAGTVTQAAGSQGLTGSLFQRSPTFFTGTVTPGAVNLAGTLFQRAPTFFTGAITARYALTGSLFSKAPTFNTGAVTVGAVNLAGVLFSKAPTFPTGAVTSTRNLSGTLFQRAPTFNVGAVTSVRNLAGTLFQRAPTFPTGAITSTRNLSGVLFSKAPTFPAGTVAPGAVNLAGTLFQRSPTFFGGVAGSGFLAGSLFSRAPTFPTGTVTPGAVNLAGTTFSKAPTFFTGAITSTRNVSGVLFQRSPTFFAGVVRQQQRLTGVLFSKAPTFFTGKVSHVLHGTLFQRSPSFFVGAVTSNYPLTGTTFVITPNFPGAGLILHQGNLLGDQPLLEVPAFFAGLIARFDYTPEWPADTGSEWPVTTGPGWPVSIGDEWTMPPGD